LGLVNLEESSAWLWMIDCKESGKLSCGCGWGLLKWSMIVTGRDKLIISRWHILVENNSMWEKRVSWSGQETSNTYFTLRFDNHMHRSVLIKNQNFFNSEATTCAISCVWCSLCWMASIGPTNVRTVKKPRDFDKVSRSVLWKFEFSHAQLYLFNQLGLIFGFNLFTCYKRWSIEDRVRLFHLYRYLVQ